MAGKGGKTISGDAVGGKGDGLGPGGNAYTGGSGNATGGAIYNEGGRIENGQFSSKLSNASIRLRSLR